MGAHAAIHAGGVGLITGNLWLALFEFVAHWLIDGVKCAGMLSFNQDQALHLVCKLAYIGIIFL